MTLHQPVIGPCAKRIYPSKTVAKKLAKRVNESGREHVAPYHCTKCHGWHLGTHSRMQDKRREINWRAMEL